MTAARSASPVPTPGARRCGASTRRAWPGWPPFATTLPDAQCRRLSEALRPILDGLGRGA